MIAWKPPQVENMPKRKDPAKTEKFFSERKAIFLGVVSTAHLIGNRIGRRQADDLRIKGSWLFIRASVTAHSVSQLFEPAPTGFGKAVYLDHSSIAVLCRALIENIAVLLYIADTTITADEWQCRMHLVDLHDFVNRRAFISRIPYESAVKDPTKLLAELQRRLAVNPFFKALPARTQKRLLEGEEMFLYGRHNAMLKLGWGEDLTRAIYKYLSNQAHSLAMSFHRTEANKVYEQGSTYPKAIAGFAAEFGYKALGVGCLRMLELFPDTELAFDPAVLAAFKKEYTPTP
jgi:hypothetical protein